MMSLASKPTHSLRRGVQELLPTAFTFLPKANAESIAFLLSSAMLGRFLVGDMRVVADWPTLNTKEGDSEDEKTKTVMERVFMELLGVPANFLAIALGQDAGFKIAEAIHPSHPKTLLNSLNQTQPVAHGEFQKALLYTFDIKASLKQLERMHPIHVANQLGNVKNPLHKNLYEQAKVNRFTDALQHLNPNLSLTQDSTAAISKFFKWNNFRTNGYAIGGGMIASTVFSGIIWQWMNDQVIRKKVVPPLVKLTNPLFFPKGDKTSTLPQIDPLTLDKQHRQVLELVSQTGNLHPNHVPPVPSYSGAYPLLYQRIGYLKSGAAI